MIQLGLFLKDHVTLKTGERDNAQNSQRDFTITVKRSYLNKQTQLWCTEEIYCGRLLSTELFYIFARYWRVAD